MKEKEENVKSTIPCLQKLKMLSKPRSIEREAKFNQSILELLSVGEASDFGAAFLLQKHLIFLYGINQTFKIQELSQVAWILTLWVDVCQSPLTCPC